MIHVFHASAALVTVMQPHMVNDESLKSFILENKNDFSHVAQVKADTLDKAKALTTHVDNNWWENDSVESNESIGLTVNARSTGSGDLLISDGKAFLVTANGYKQVDGLYNIETIQ